MMRVIEVEYRGGAIYQYQDYDDRGNPGTVRLAVGAPEEKVITHTFHPEMNVRLSSTEVSVLGGSNKVTIWDYDNDYDAIPNESPTRLLSRIVEQGLTKNLSGDVISYEYITTFTYNSKGQILTIDGPLAGSNDMSTFAYDTVTGDLNSLTRPLIGTITFSNHDPAGQLGRVTDVNGQSKSFSCDGRGRITTITNDVDGSTTVYNYNTAGQLDSMTDADGITRAFTYDTQYGRLTKLIDPDGNYISYGYDSQGNRTELSYHDPSDNRTYRKRYSYQQPDLPGKLWKIINPDDTYTEYGYDSAGNITSVTDPATHITTYAYDSLNRLVTAIQPGDVNTSYSYNSQDKLSTVIDAKGRQTTYLYDDMGRVISATSPDTGAVSYVYDEGGNLISKTDAKGITVTYTYDQLNRLTAIYFPDSSQDITRFYDQGTNGKGRLTGMTDSSGSMVNRYDALGRLIRDTRTIAGCDFTTEYTYSAVGRLTGIIYPGGREVTYNRNSLGKIAGVTSAYDGDTSTLVSNLTYLPFGPSEGMDVGSGSGTNNIFDELYRMLTANPGAESERTYSYDGNSNIISINVTNNPDKDQTFTYDSLNRLMTAANIYDSGYTYDKVGNRLTRTIDDQIETYTYITGANKLLEVTGPNPMTFTYDANGNTAAIGDKTLIYNQNNRLVSVTETPLANTHTTAMARG
jgi:YD repeat-containing protein